MATALDQIPVGETGVDEGIGTLQLVSFRLASEEYGIEITKVQEIILMGEITRVPQTPEYIMGLINLRSTVIPIIDLRLRFALPQEKVSDETRIMVVNVASKTIGIIVDAVSEVLRISDDQIAPPPPTVAGLGRDSVSQAVVESTVSMANALDILVVAEGVETEAQRTLVRDLGVDLMQGFLFQRPAPAEEYARSGPVWIPGADARAL